MLFCRDACLSALVGRRGRSRIPWLSPINGSLAGIGPLLLAIGTDESIHPDALLFRERALAEGVDLEFMEKEGLAHLFQFAPIPEAKPVLDRYVERLKH